MSATLACPECGATATAADTFCTSCGKYLGWADTPEPATADAAADATAAAAARPDSVPPLLDPVPPTPPVPAPTPPAAAPSAPTAAPAPAATAAAPAAPRVVAAAGRPCATCGTPNPESRKFCLQCGAMLAPAPTPPPATAPLKAPKSVRPNRRLPTILGAVAALAVVAVAAGVFTRGGGDDSSGSTTPGSPTTVVSTGTVAPRPIDPATITASASSVLPPQDTSTYGAGNTLDGNLETAWNDGSPGTGAGEKLTYRFAGPVQLVTIRLVNGYAYSQDLFEKNARIRAAVFVTDSGRFPVTLPDTLDIQEVTMDFGQTSSVILEVVSVYPGNKYEDLALSEIEFVARPAA